MNTPVTRGLAPRPTSARCTGNGKHSAGFTRDTLERHSMRASNLSLHQNKLPSTPRTGTPGSVTPTRNFPHNDFTRFRNVNNTPTPKLSSNRVEPSFSSKRRNGLSINDYLLDRIREGSVSEISKSLLAGADANVADISGRPVLQMALVLRSGDPGIVRLLLEHGARPGDVCRSTGMNSIHVTSKLGYQVSLSAMLISMSRSGEVGGPLNARDFNGRTPLMLACRHGHDGIVRELLRYGAEITPDGVRGKANPLHEAVEGRSLACVLELLEVWPNIVTLTNEASNENQSVVPIIITAVKTGQLDIIEELIGHSHPPDINSEDRSTGRTALHYAAEAGNAPVLQALLRAGAELNRRDLNWNTAFSLALTHHHRQVLKLLIQQGCDVRGIDKSLNTALHVAARAGMEDVVQVLGDRGMDVNIKGEGGMTPLMLACLGGHVRTVETLLSHGAETDLMDRHHASAVCFTLLSTLNDSLDIRVSCSIIMLLIQHGADLDISARLKGLVNSLEHGPLEHSRYEDTMYSPLEIAFILRQVEIFDLLLQNGVDVREFNCKKSDLLVTKFKQGANVSNRMNEVHLANKILQSLQKCRGSVRSLSVLCRKPALEYLKANKERVNIVSIWKSANKCVHEPSDNFRNDTLQPNHSEALKTESQNKKAKEYNSEVHGSHASLRSNSANFLTKDILRHSQLNLSSRPQTPEVTGRKSAIPVSTKRPGPKESGLVSPAVHNRLFTLSKPESPLRVCRNKENIPRNCNKPIQTGKETLTTIPADRNKYKDTSTGVYADKQRYKEINTGTQAARPRSKNCSVTLTEVASKRTYSPVVKTTESHNYLKTTTPNKHQTVSTRPSSSSRGTITPGLTRRAIGQGSNLEVLQRRSESAASDDSGMCLSSIQESTTTDLDSSDETGSVDTTIEQSLGSDFQSIESLKFVNSVNPKLA